MTENTPEQPLPTPEGGDPDPTPDPTPTTPEQDAPKRRRASSGDTRYAVFNDTLQQFVGPVTAPGDPKPTAAEAKERVPKGHKASVREV